MSQMQARTESHTAAGIALGVIAFGWWGMFPLYLRALHPASANEILAHRVAWAAVFLTVLAAARFQIRAVLQLLLETRTLVLLSASTVLIAVNWWVYTWAVNSNHVLQASLGYYLNPLVNVLLGFVFLRERLRRVQWIAVAVAFTGVGFLIARMLEQTLGGAASDAGRPTLLVTFIPLVLALSFGMYGLLRKVASVDSVNGLTLETVLLAPLCFAYILHEYRQASSTFLTHGFTAHDALLVGSGAVTAVPLLCFTAAARRLRLATLGMIQYIAPTGQFLLAVFRFGEQFTTAHKVAFACIWTAVALYSLDAWRASRPGLKAQ